MGACMNGHLEVARWLLDNGAATGVATAGTTGRSSLQLTPILLASQKGHARRFAERLVARAHEHGLPAYFLNIVLERFLLRPPA